MFLELYIMTYDGAIANLMASFTVVPAKRLAATHLTQRAEFSATKCH